MTGQDLLDRMEDLNNELQLQSSEAGVVRGLRSLNVAQDYFETLAAVQEGILGSHTSTLTTTLDTETTAFPTGLLRLDSLWFIDPDTSRPSYQIGDIQTVGGHVDTLPWAVRVMRATSTGAPSAYWTNGRLIYWQPLPDATHTVRWYGWQRQADVTAGGTFAYDDGVAEPMAALAVEILRRGVDDPVTEIMELAERTFETVLKTLSRFQRQRPQGRHYEYVHTT